MSTHVPASLIWFDTPADLWNWRASLPLGNGRLGALVHGGANEDLIVLNEDSIWARLKANHNNKGALEALPRVRQLLFDGKPQEALDLAEDRMMGAPMRVQPYQPLGSLNLRFKARGETRDYRRELDLDTAVTRVEYEQDGAVWKREMFCSAVDQVLVVRLTCDATNNATIDFSCNLSRAWDAKTENTSFNEQTLTGQAGTEGTRFFALMRIIDESGTGSVEAHGDRLVASGARALTILLVARTDYRNEDWESQARQDMEQAGARSYHELKSRHIAEHQGWFRRARVELHGANDDESLKQMPTEARLKRVREGADDPALASLYFSFGRYLLIASSRPGTMPANLQGIWNPLMDPPWASDYHANINIQMNYWPSGVCNLSECQMPLFDWLETLVEPGRETARVHYGCEGFVVHHLSDPWGFTVPADTARCGLWPMGGAWLCDHVWEQWLFEGDERWLREAGFPLLRENALFLLSFLVEDKAGRLISGPSASPENNYFLPDGSIGSLCMGPSMDTQIIRETLGHCLEAARLLQTEDELQNRIESTLKRLPEHRIGKHGQLQEWMEDYDEPEPGHRHISHLFALHPGTQISIRRTPQLAQAAIRTLERRMEHGGAHTGWSAAWIAAHRARLGQSEEAHETFLYLLRHSTYSNLMGEAHGHMQLDNVFGGTAAIGEMLLQSHEEEVSLLPSLPSAWPHGAFHGLRARGGFEVSAQWRDGQLESATLLSLRGNVCRLRAPRSLQITRDSQTIEAREVDGAWEFETVSGASYQVK